MKQNDKAINAAGKSRPIARVMPGAGTAVLRTVTTASLLGLSHLHSRDPGRPSKSAKPTLLQGHGPLTGGQMPSSEAAGELTAARVTGGTTSHPPESLHTETSVSDCVLSLGF